jgi:hypothetical protein
MRESQESAAEGLWKEKIDSCASPQEAVVLLVLLAAVIAVMAIWA